MTLLAKGEQLIQDLHKDPQKFAEEGRSYALLQAYFDGLGLESLRALLASPDPWIQRVSAFIASELGVRARALITDVLPLLNSPEPLVQNYAMEVLSVCAEGEEFGNVVAKLESAHQGLRLQAMGLLANASSPQLRSAVAFFQRGHRDDHVRGLKMLMSDGPTAGTLYEGLRSKDALRQQYSAVAARRFGLVEAVRQQAAWDSNADAKEFLAESE